VIKEQFDTKQLRLDTNTWVGPEKTQEQFSEIVFGARDLSPTLVGPGSVEQ